jgi:hypothetical protein
MKLTGKGGAGAAAATQSSRRSGWPWWRRQSEFKNIGFGSAGVGDLGVSGCWSLVPEKDRQREGLEGGDLRRAGW